MHPESALTSLAATRLGRGVHAVLARSTHPARGAPDGLRVVSVHAAVVNLATPDGTLVALAHAAVGGLPNGILVADAPDFTTLGLRPGTAATWSEGALHVRGGTATRLRVDTRGAADWSPAVTAHDTGAWPARSERATAAAGSVRVPGGLADLAPAMAPLRSLDCALRARDRLAAAWAARGLIGLGVGLTPSGDDALAGVEAALHAAGHPTAGFLALALDDVDRRTTTLGAAMLRHAARGDAAERVHDLLDVLLDPATPDLEGAIAGAARWGATSGSDLLLGVLLGLGAATGVPSDVAATSRALRTAAA